MKTRADAVLRGIGLLLGFSLAVIVVLSSRIPPGTGFLGADLIVASGPTGELAVSPIGPFISATNLTPGPETTAPSGDLKILNQTGSTLRVQVRGLPSTKDLDSTVMVDVTSSGDPIFHGTLGDFRGWSTGSVTLAPGQRADLSVSTWLANTEDRAWAGAIAQYSIEFRSTVIGGSA